MRNEPSRERSGYVGGVGAVRVNASCNTCGRSIQPSDFQSIGDGRLQAICSSCHHDVAYIDLDLEFDHCEPANAA